ncbi:ATP-binding protein [Hyphomonas sp.]|uniref:ATP-binding protein n=1 Tax=Hyphomonas sp. TaxID=87 RepID=UPI00391D9157
MPVRLQEIALAVPPVPSSTMAGAALSLFLSDPAMFALPILRAGAEEGGAAGISHVTRARFMEGLAGPNGRDIFMSRPVIHLASPHPVIAEGSTPVALIAKQAAEKGTSALTDGVIVLKDGAYAGIAAPSSILKAVAEENTARARAQHKAQAQVTALESKLKTIAEGRARLLGFIGHEIRTPLTGILGVADLISEQAPNSDLRRLAETIAGSGQHLERLLNDLLDLSRIEAGKLTVSLQPFDLRQFAGETRDLWQPRLDAKRVALRMAVARNAEARIESDAARLRQILFNLVSNAVKFTERGHVTVQLYTEPAGDELSLIMTVTDTGRGISDADKARLFEAFEQGGEMTADAAGGAGLGLAIARALARRLGGDIALADNPGGGCIFTVAVPVRKAGPRLAVDNPVPARPASFSLGEVLIAEDHETTAFVMREALIAAGWRVEVAPDAATAAARIAVRRYQAILTDVHMPGGGGDSVLWAARSASSPNRSVPVLAVTADLSPERRLACERAGYSSLVEKPVRPRHLVAALADAVISAGRETRATAS